MHPVVRLSIASFCVAATLAGPLPALAQNSPAPVTFTADQDHQNMMDQLGIKALRPGPSGNESDANHANYDESTANPYPNLPDVLTMNDGKKVTNADEWWKQRRPEIEHDMQEYVYGFVPKNAPKVTWTVKVLDHEMV
ncbi:MAG TPA: acetylxylan esterase, partial [Acidobacteriaceae bacterium]|nr:acetylxylan esterase [Acidobacteriaceae bacterium]